MPKCRDCKSLEWSPVCRAHNLLNRNPVRDENAEHDCSGFQPGPKPLVEELVAALRLSLSYDRLHDVWLKNRQYEHWAFADILRHVLPECYVALARHEKEQANDQQ